MAGCWTRGPRIRSSDGWIWVSRPRSRLERRVASPARSSSKPTIISSSAMVSSSTSMERRVWGTERAASDDERVPGIGLGLARVEVGDPAHRQAGQIGGLAARVAGDGQRQGADRGRLVHHDEHGVVLGLELGEDLAEFRARCWAAACRRLSSRPESVWWRGVRPCRRPGRGRRRCHWCRSRALSGRTHPASPAAPAASIHITKNLPHSRRSRWSCPSSAVCQCLRGRSHHPRAPGPAWERAVRLHGDVPEQPHRRPPPGGRRVGRRQTRSARYTTRAIWTRLFRSSWVRMWARGL
jgi:hypothetical protein